MAKQTGLFSYWRKTAFKRGRIFHTKKSTSENSCVLTCCSLLFINKENHPIPIYLSLSTFHPLHPMSCPIPKSTALPILYGCSSNCSSLRGVILCTGEAPQYWPECGWGCQGHKNILWSRKSLHHMLFQCTRSEAELRSGLRLISVSESDIQTDHPGAIDYSACYQPMGKH